MPHCGEYGQASKVRNTNKLGTHRGAAFREVVGGGASHLVISVQI